ncbi:MAG: cyclic pyranopterin monophosphate synthase MoaC [Gemmatimonadetes bacterium]|nr:cyclic pyranopterin monophosphate synthase MoaC [Gemmatimonadota bacterium]MBP6444044.1 cyclic pyranopterin monophosphate synthase MoaC [Gemmatimonadales bacterium]MBP6570454.1 cyclic pyranopterin monophosphate synthase MoaC [Gemmatimonadales bacterium]MBP9897846.1 cyclic pyranopterin monophosphate synthase MoaC [Gemmatimonadales bacterium]
MSLTHLDAQGRARMVDVGEKAITRRIAVAEGNVLMSAAAFALVRDATATKGDVLTVAEVAGVMGAKQTASLIPLCHPVPLDRVTVSTELVPEWPGVRIVATATATARTGIEMEALVAVSVAALTVYDMIKAADRGARIEQIRLLEKAGGARGDWHAPDSMDLKGGMHT